MSEYDKYGIYRSIEPKGVFPIYAWKLNNDMTLGDHELLVDVKILKVERYSFLQIQEESNNDIGKIASKIIEIVNARGKMHNVVTGTGGLLYGKVAKLGKAYKNNYDVAVGDEIISIVSLTAIPFIIDRILNIDIHSAQVEVIGQAIIFEVSPIVKKPDSRVPLKLLLTALELAGEAAETSRIVKEGDDVIVLGAASIWGLMCSFSAKDKLGSSGRIIGVVNTVDDKRKIEKYKIFDQVVYFDGRNTLKMIELQEFSGLFDVVINCQMISYTDTASVLLAKNKGTVYLDGCAGDTTITSLIAEAIGKDLTIVYYKGHVEGDVKLVISLIEKYPILRDILDAEITEDPWNDSLKDSLSLSSSKSVHPFVFESTISKDLLKKALKASKYDCTVLINGESGVGKEGIAQIIYENSYRNIFNYVKINCAAIPEHLLEAELFGYEKGAFTGADPKGKIGLWEKANHGILFLDEISELSRTLQAKLLRAVQENEIYKIGGTEAIKTDVRIVAATNNNLLEMVKRKEFREDLYFRLNVFPIYIPPLRERKDDIVPLTNMFAEEYNKKYNTHRTISEDALKTLCHFEWPGNIRELQNFIQRLFIDVDQDSITTEEINRLVQVPKTTSTNMVIEKEKNSEEDVKLLEILSKSEFEILKTYKEKYKTTRKIAQALGLSQTAVVKKLRKYNL